MNRRQSMVRRGVAITGAIMLATVVGCGGGDEVRLVQVTGTVTLDGEPLYDAAVVFHPVSGGRPSVGRTDGSGRYQLEYVQGKPGAIAGEHKVSISTYIEPDADSSDPARQAGFKEVLPAQYNAQTTLAAELQVGRREVHDFPLESRGSVTVSKSSN